MEKKTPLYDYHVKLGGKIVPFAGYLLPVQYPTGVIKEHMAVREKAGLFDVSHMGEIMFTGPSALASLNHLLTNDYTNMPINKVRYGVMCNENGGVIDDLIVYKFAEEEYFVVVNASNKDKDYAHMQKNILPGTKIDDVSDEYGQLALQGPQAHDILATLLAEDQIPAKYYTVNKDAIIAGMKCIVSYTGYTGEKGYEIYTSPQDITKLYELLLEKGQDKGLIPCGLGARDTLRLEAAMPLYGHEMNDEITPLETGLNFGVKMNKEEFIGKKAIEAKGEPKITRVGLVGVSRGIMREKQDVYFQGNKVGTTTSGTFGPYVNKAIAMALINVEANEVDRIVQVDVRGNMVDAKIVKLPFYQTAK